jgi:uncharacterized protein (DUF488 family)
MLYTIGHSNHEIAVFLGLLRRHGVTAVGDVRSQPHSRWVPQYSREALEAALTDAGIAYVFLGKELGARSDNPACYRDGKVQYDRLAEEPIFAEGIGRVVQGMQRYKIALMCAEKDPLDCHRALLVARRLFETGVAVSHIHADGGLEGQQAMESRLLALCKLPEKDLFTGRAEFVAEAYRLRGERVAYQEKDVEHVEQQVDEGAAP